jgi:hypothetical protein
MPMKILYVPLEYAKWEKAQYWSYPEGLGLEEGFAGCNAECFVLPGLIQQHYYAPESFLDHARRLCAGTRFDAVWLTIPHVGYDPGFLEWVAKMAPVRVGYFVERMGRYWSANPQESSRYKRKMALASLPYLTHALAWDEADLAVLKARGIPAMWCPVHVPERFVKTKPAGTSSSVALFFGAVYGERVRYLNDPALSGLLLRPDHSLEHETQYPQIFDALNIEVMRHLAAQDVWNPRLLAQRLKRRLWRFLRRPFKRGKEKIPDGVPPQLESLANQGVERLLTGYMERFRESRLKNFGLWLDTIAQGFAMVNLPQAGFGYGPRVVESMAVGRPVLAHRVPNRPQMEDLFQNEREILLYDNPEGLAAQIRHLQKDPGLRDRLVNQAQRKLLQAHTTERRVSQALRWLESGQVPDFYRVSKN